MMNPGMHTEAVARRTPEHRRVIQLHRSTASSAISRIGDKFLLMAGVDLQKYCYSAESLGSLNWRHTNVTGSFQFEMHLSRRTNKDL